MAFLTSSLHRCECPCRFTSWETVLVPTG